MTAAIPDISVVLLHAGMVNKQGDPVTTSLTMIDVHDFARSSRTFGAHAVYIAHPSSALRRLSRTLKAHWEDGYGATYNPNRKDAIEHVHIVSTLDEAITHIDQRTGRLPKIVATSARRGEGRISYKEMHDIMIRDQQPYLIMFGTGWGMGQELMSRADYLLNPIEGPGEYNHLSVRSACAIVLDRLVGK